MEIESQCQQMNVELRIIMVWRLTLCMHISNPLVLVLCICLSPHALCCL